jgi:threonine/homoserine/homoserine lactone efflux protein
MIAVTVGVGTLVERSVAPVSVLKVLGAAYLVYLGVHSERKRLASALEVSSPHRRPGVPTSFKAS